jgi:hypothetical protein
VLFRSVPPWSRAETGHYTPGWTGSQPKALKRGSLRYRGLGRLPRVCGMILRCARRDFEQGTQEQLLWSIGIFIQGSLHLRMGRDLFTFREAVLNSNGANHLTASR